MIFLGLVLTIFPFQKERYLVLYSFCSFYVKISNPMYLFFLLYFHCLVFLANKFLWLSKLAKPQKAILKIIYLCLSMIKFIVMLSLCYISYFTSSKLLKGKTSEQKKSSNRIKYNIVLKNCIKINYFIFYVIFQCKCKKNSIQICTSITSKAFYVHG